jgi:hypothetical protein
MKSAAKGSAARDAFYLSLERIGRYKAKLMPKMTKGATTKPNPTRASQPERPFGSSASPRPGVDGGASGGGGAAQVPQLRQYAELSGISDAHLEQWIGIADSLW